MRLFGLEDILSKDLSVAEWSEYFCSLTEAQFIASLHAVVCSGRPTSPPLLIGLARQLLRHGYYSEGLTEQERESFIAKADVIADLLLEGAEPSMAETFREAWAKDKDVSERFGYKSGAIWDALRPHRVFAVGEDRPS